MGTFQTFVIRLILSMLFAVLACRIFFQGTPLIRVFGLGVLLLGLAYLFEYVRKRNREGDDGS
jgi:uncharacterized membrane protein